MNMNKKYMTWALASALVAAVGFALERTAKSGRSGDGEGLTQKVMRGATDKRHMMMQAATEAFRAFQRVMENWGSDDRNASQASQPRDV